jgi:hypothetical protein
MSIIYLILATIEILLYTATHISYVNQYSPYVRGSNFAKITGGIIAAVINGICCWYIISEFIKAQHWDVLL